MVIARMSTLPLIFLKSDLIFLVKLIRVSGDSCIFELSLLIV
jgi:hypothetical protein